MKFYSKPEIEALALETVDVIETSGAEMAQAALSKDADVDAEVKVIDEQISRMSIDWQW